VKCIFKGDVPKFISFAIKQVQGSTVLDSEVQAYAKYNGYGLQARFPG
jgi:hypothetical protein